MTTLWKNVPPQYRWRYDALPDTAIAKMPLLRRAGIGPAREAFAAVGDPRLGFALDGAINALRLMEPSMSRWRSVAVTTVWAEIERGESLRGRWERELWHRGVAHEIFLPLGTDSLLALAAEVAVPDLDDARFESMLGALLNHYQVTDTSGVGNFTFDPRVVATLTAGEIWSLSPQTARKSLVATERGIAGFIRVEASETDDLAQGLDVARQQTVRVYR